jgi:hypothetical protein
VPASRRCRRSSSHSSTRPPNYPKSWNDKERLARVVTATHPKGAIHVHFVFFQQVYGRGTDRRANPARGLPSHSAKHCSSRRRGAHTVPSSVDILAERIDFPRRRTIDHVFGRSGALEGSRDGQRPRGRGWLLLLLLPGMLLTWRAELGRRRCRRP